VDAVENDGSMPLFDASYTGNLAVVRELLARGAAVDTARSCGVMPLFIASQRGHVEVVRELLGRGANAALYHVKWLHAAGHCQLVGPARTLFQILPAGAYVNVITVDG
jgi:ankyrin repeat protein